MPDRPQARSYTSGDQKNAKASSRARRERIKRTAPRPTKGWRTRLMQPALVKGAFVALCFSLVAGALISWTREQPRFAEGRIAERSHIVRTAFSVEDTAATEARRDLARNTAPRVYRAIETTFRDIESSIDRLPTALADADTLDKVIPEILTAFNLTQDRLDAIREYVVAGAADQTWNASVRRLMDTLRRMPIVDQETYQHETLEPNIFIELRADATSPVRRGKDLIINVASEDLAGRLRRAVRDAGFAHPVAELLTYRLSARPTPTYIFDEASTEELRQAAADSTPTQTATYPEGRVLAARGETIDDNQRATLLEEHWAHNATIAVQERWTSRLALLAASMAVSLAAFWYIAFFCPRIRRNPARVLAIAALSLLALGATCAAATASPGLIAIIAVPPVVFFAAIIVIAYDQRTAIALAVLQAFLIGFAIESSLGVLAASLLAAGVIVWRLSDIRRRNTVIYAGIWAAGVAVIATFIATIVTLPGVPGLLGEAFADAMLAGFGCLVVGFLTLGILPTIERVFDITTAMTLIELRDTRRPLLRELQQRAPGTYQHSYTVATLAENAADAIGADALHVFVGALYHDIGKMNKPDYFVENQSGSFNRHSRLSPAMSLLVIVGHVKDGIELAKEHNLPRPMHHYIESHHGTTLVQYFFHSAKKQAEEANESSPEEIEYRYAGPKPRTKEAAILLLCDCVESATRAMSEPTPSRIEALVRDLATKRLMDGQFDDSELTLRELHIVEESLTKTLCSVYHGRISYPTAEKTDAEKQAKPEAKASSAS